MIVFSVFLMFLKVHVQNGASLKILQYRMDKGLYFYHVAWMDASQRAWHSPIVEDSHSMPRMVTVSSITRIKAILSLIMNGFSGKK